MCGLFGIIGQDLTNSDVQMFKTGLHVTSLRGAHSTGVVKIFNKLSDDKTWYQSEKDNVNSVEFIEKNDDILSSWTTERVRALLGHCRHATVGGVTKENAHPFEVGDIIGMHNGTLRTTFTGKYNKSTDSESAFTWMQDNGLKEAIKTFRGAYAFVWWDSRSHTVHIIRNNERSLFYVKDHNQFYYSSEKSILMFALYRHNRVALVQDIKELPVFTELSFNVRKGVLSIETMKEVKHEAPTFFTGTTGTTNYHGASRSVNRRVGDKYGGKDYTEDYVYDVESRLFLTRKEKKRLDKARALQAERAKAQQEKEHKHLKPVNNNNNVAYYKTSAPSVKRTTLSPEALKNLEGYKGTIRSINGESFFDTPDLLELNSEEASAILHTGCHWCGEQQKLEDWEDIYFLSGDIHVCDTCNGKEFLFENIPWTKARDIVASKGN